MFYRSALLSLALTFLCVHSLAQTDPFSDSRMNSLPGHDHMHEAFSSVSGSVTNIENRPLENVRVDLRSPNGTTITSAYTGATGSFEFSQVQSGTYEVVASSGTDQVQERVDINGVAPSISLRLPVRSSPIDGRGNTSVSVAQYRVPEKAKLELLKAQEASVKGRDNDAQKDVDKALEIYPQYADALTLRAILKMNANDVPGATSALQEAIRNDPNCGLAYIVMGAILNSQSKFDDAMRFLQRGQSLSPNSWQGQFEMGRALLGKAQCEAALHQFERAQALLMTDYPLIHLAKAHALFGLHHYTDAVTELQAFLAKAPQGPHSQGAHQLLAQAQAAIAQSGK